MSQRLHAHGRRGQPRQHEGAARQALGDARSLAVLADQAGLQQRVGGAGGGDAFVDDPGPRLDPGAAQVFLQRSGLTDGRDFGQRDQNDVRHRRILQPHQRRDDVHGLRSAFAAFVLLHHLPVVGTGGVHQQQAVAGGRGVQHHKSAARFIHHAAEGMEHGDFFGAGRLQVFEQQRLALFIQRLAARRHDFCNVSLGFRLGVDAADFQVRQTAVEGLRHMRRRVGGGQVNAVAALHQPYGQRSGNRGFADAALAHDHDQAVAQRGQFVGQPAERLGGQISRCPVGSGRDNRHGTAAEQGAQSRQADGVKSAQRHFVARQAGQGVRHLRDGFCAQGFDGAGDGVIKPAGMKHAVDEQALVRQAQRAQFFGGARRLLHGARVGPGDQNHGGQRRIAQCRQRSVEARFLHLQPRVRAQAGSATVIAGQKAAPRLGQAQQAQRVAGWGGVENEVVVALRATAFVGQQRGKFVKGGNFSGAGTRQLLAHRGAFVVTGTRLQLRQHPQAIGFGGGIRVDIEHAQTRHRRHRNRLVGQPDAQHFVEVGRCIGADQQHTLACVSQRNRRGGGQRSLADAAFAGKKQKTRGCAKKTASVKRRGVQGSVHRVSMAYRKAN